MTEKFKPVLGIMERNRIDDIWTVVFRVINGGRQSVPDDVLSGIADTQLEFEDVETGFGYERPHRRYTLILKGDEVRCNDVVSLIESEVQKDEIADVIRERLLQSAR